MALHFHTPLGILTLSQILKPLNASWFRMCQFGMSGRQVEVLAHAGPCPQRDPAQEATCPPTSTVPCTEHPVAGGEEKGQLCFGVGSVVGIELTESETL